ncbi:hypothetical protein RN001_000990 [Aquatica leii]|uniref:BTB domain-containing protein n=1 Tax=Aquatica leii TaxID=1421715 RepID=A0AAN7Q3K0_9COLE|nr:hypothetical protein RN001_000990 [Aquatica leii]
MADTNLQERDCTELCKSTQHGNIICGTLTKRQVLDCDICAYLKLLCSCCENVKDPMGRTALHIAASCGRLEVIKWLIKSRHANINAKDRESGYTPLHRSIFYGKINVSVHLIKLGANVTITDFNGLTSLEHAMKDSWRLNGLRDIHHGEVYVWGSNTNYTFGTQEARLTPEMLYVFHKEYSNVKIEQICLEKFHCILLSSEGKVYACGHGQGGRLGLGSEKTVITPKQIKFSASGHANAIVCKKISVAVDHSIFLSESGHIWTTGLNTHRVLGINPPPSQVLTPCPLPLLHHTIYNVCAAKYHSVAWGPTGIYTWGLHGGQLGHAKATEKYIVTPKLVTVMFGHEAKIIAVAVSVGATAVLTSKGDVYIMHDYHCRLILKKQLNLVSVSVVGGKLNEKLDNSLSSEINHELKVIALSNVGNLYLWQSSSPQFARCIFSINHSLCIRQVAFNLNEILFVTNEGEAFRGVIKPRKLKTVETNLQLQKSDFYEFIDSGHLIKISKIPHVHRALSINSDLKGCNYAVLQALPNIFVKNLPLISSSIMEENMGMFLQDTTEDDAIHDVIFQVAHSFFPAHRYIIASCSSKLNDLTLKNANKIVEITDVHPEIFEQMLLFIYTGTCQLLKNCRWKLSLHVCSSKQDEKCPLCVDNKNPVRLLQDISKRFGMKTLQKLLDNVFYDNESVTVNYKNNKQIPKFFRNSFPEMQDVILKTKDGIEIFAHKCILSARLEYFNSLFSVRWNEDITTKEVSFPFPYSIAIQLVEFLYTDDLPLLRNEDIDHICQLLIVADQLFVIRLKEICEYTLTSHVTLKNVAQMISFASIYNAHQLKSYCMEFICVNLCSILELRSLELLDDDILCDITEFYSNFNPVMQYRIITPYSYAPSDEVVASASSTLQVSLENDNSHVVKSISKTPKRRSRTRKTSSMESSNNKDDDISNSGHIQQEHIVENISYNSSEMKHMESGEVLRVKSRLKALENARTILICDNHPREFIKLPLRSSNLSVNDFPELNSSSSLLAKTPNKLEKTESKYNKITKLSQKQRKRLSSESSLTSVENNPIILSESPKNPWKIPSPLSCSPTDPSQSFVAMHSIIIEERKQKQNFVKMKTKLLVHTQIEDKAIEDLHKFYNVDNVFDEVITIQRVQIGRIASPVWVK